MGFGYRKCQISVIKAKTTPGNESRKLIPPHKMAKHFFHYQFGSVDEHDHRRDQVLISWHSDRLVEILTRLVECELLVVVLFIFASTCMGIKRACNYAYSTIKVEKQKSE